MDFTIDPIKESEYVEVVEIWESSVRATHNFLTEEDIQYFKPLILKEYLKAVELRSARDAEGKILGFLGVADRGLEMLFLDPKWIGKGVGAKLMKYALHHFEVNKVDVNEQNPQAVEFYKRFNFKVVSRSELDGTGKPYPILHMELDN